MVVRLKSFKPLIDHSSRILILGTMPGPEALRLQQYYGFAGNHFWKILPVIFAAKPPRDYRAKVALLKKHRIALWDVFGSCTRRGAADNAIRGERLNDVPALLERYPSIRHVFANGQKASKAYRRYFESKTGLKVVSLPSTSPANASVSFGAKLAAWKIALSGGIDCCNEYHRHQTQS